MSKDSTTNEVKSASNAKIKEALALLEEAAKEKKDDLKNLLADKYSNLKETLSSVEGKIEQPIQAFSKRVADTAVDVKEKGLEKSKEIAEIVDDRVRKNPWPYLGGVALGALLLGFYFGKDKNK